MAAPEWITRAGSLGIAVELEPFEFSLQVRTGIFRATFAVIAGQVPPGLTLTERGNIQGYPVGRIAGVPLAVNEEIAFEFVVRCTNELGEISDRTFGITVTGQDPPEPRIAPFSNQSLGVFTDASWIDIDVSGFDPDPGDRLSYALVGGSLPAGLQLLPTGRIQGYADPAVFVLEQERFDTQGFDVVSFDQSSVLNSRDFAFSIQVSDGKDPRIANYVITLINTLSISADSTEFTSDTVLPNDLPNNYVPVLAQRGTDLGTVTDQNFFYQQFSTISFDATADIRYEILPIVRYPSLVGTQADPAVPLGASFQINEQLFTVPAVVRTANTSSAATNLVQLDSLSDLQLGFTVQSANIAAVSSNSQSVRILQLIQPDTVLLNSNIAVDAGEQMLFGDSSVTALAQLINSRSITDLDFAAVSAAVQLNALNIFTTEPSITLRDVTGSALSSAGIDVFFAQRNTQDTDLVPSADPTQLLPPGVQLNTHTGWLYGYIEPQSQGSRDYDFFVRIYNNSTEPVQPVALVDYALELPFSSLLSVTAEQLQQLGVDLASTDFAQRTLIFVQQDQFADPDSQVWDDGVQLVPGYTEKSANPSTVQNQRAGIWRLVPAGSAYTLQFDQEIFANQAVQARRYVPSRPGAAVLFQARWQYATPADWSSTASYVAGDRVVFAGDVYVCTTDTGPDAVFPGANFTTSVPWYVQVTAQNPLSSVWPQRLRVQSSLSYQLNWITNSLLADLTVGTSSQLQVQAATSAGSRIRYELVALNHKQALNSTVQNQLLRLDSVEDLHPGMRLVSAAFDSPQLILAVFADTQQVQLSQPQTVPAGTRVSVQATDIPRGLRLTASGQLQGRPSHQHWRLEDGTEFDAGDTTFDRQYVINVRASTVLTDPVGREISSVRSFVFRVLDLKQRPACNLLLTWLLPEQQRAQLQQLIFNDALVPDEHVYRAADHWFGRQTSLRQLVAPGLDPVTDQQLAAALAEYHHGKRYRFTELAWAQALDSAGQVQYELIYLVPTDEFTSVAGTSFTGSVTSTATSVFRTDSTSSSTDSVSLLASAQTLSKFTPASLPNQQQQLRRVLGAFDPVWLPSWMNSRQPSGRVPGLTPAVPLVYMKPGTGRRALFRLSQQLNLSTLNPRTDRYVWDAGLIINYDVQNQKFLADPLSTFDQNILDQQQVQVLDTVDLAVSVPFFQLHQARAQQVQQLGLLDGYRGPLNGLRLVFYQQENFSNLPDFQQFQGWAYVIPQYDDDFDQGYETFQVVPGFDELANYDTAPVWSNSASFVRGQLIQHQQQFYYCILNHGAQPSFPQDFFVLIRPDQQQLQRTGIWRLEVDSTGILLLHFERPVSYSSTAPWSSVRVRTGVTHGGSVVSLVPALTLSQALQQPRTVPGWLNTSQLAQQSLNTEFDAGTTEFFGSHTDSYTAADAGAKYLVFAKQHFIDQGTVNG